jgi:hypothetical protein
VEPVLDVCQEEVNLLHLFYKLGLTVQSYLGLAHLDLDGEQLEVEKLCHATGSCSCLSVSALSKPHPSAGGVLPENQGGRPGV